MDFDDLLVRTRRPARELADVRERWQGAFSYLLVDEYQDTNHAQYRIVQPALPARTATSAWSATTTSRSTPGAAPTSATSSTSSATSRTRASSSLEQNYRSTQRILDAANAVIEHNARPKPSASGPSSAGEPVTRDRGRRRARRGALRRRARSARSIEGGSRAREIAIFYRTNAQSRVLEDAARPPRRALPGHRRHRASTSAPRSRTCWRT